MSKESSRASLGAGCLVDLSMAPWFHSLNPRARRKELIAS